MPARRKLTAAQVDFIRTSRMTQRAIADRLGISDVTVSRVRRGLHYSELPGAGAALSQRDHLPSLRERILETYIPEPNSGCWLWLGHVNEKGYGTLVFNDARMLAHRESYQISNGPIPDGLMALHRCDVRSCINPAHLFLGTAADNAQDMSAKGRHLFGERNAKAKLTDEKVRAILNDTRSAEIVGADYGVSGSNILHIRHGRAWRHITR